MHIQNDPMFFALQKKTECALCDLTPYLFIDFVDASLYRRNL